MEFQLRKTNELALAEKERICDLFREVFDLEKPLEQFLSQFERNAFGYSYHGLMLDAGRIVGCYTSIPFRYHCFGKEEVFALSVDTMIHPDYRGSPFNLKKMAESVYAGLKADGITFVFGSPNDNIYLVRKKILKWVDITELDFHVLPLRIGALKAWLKPLDPASRLFAMLVNAVCGGSQASAWTAGASFPVEKANGEDFVSYRFRQFGQERYKVVSRAGGHFVYKLDVSDGVKTGHLLDVFPLNRRNVQAAVRHIYMTEGHAIDAIAYVGTLDFRPLNLYKVPKRFRPRTVRVSGKILLEDRLDKRIFDVSHWNLNLSNFDFV